jgi:hypothetical protein
MAVWCLLFQRNAPVHHIMGNAGMLGWFYFALVIAWGTKKATHQEIDKGMGPRPHVAANQLKKCNHKPKDSVGGGGGEILDKTQLWQTYGGDVFTSFGAAS